MSLTTSKRQTVLSSFYIVHGLSSHTTRERCFYFGVCTLQDWSPYWRNRSVHILFIQRSDSVRKHLHRNGLVHSSHTWILVDEIIPKFFLRVKKFDFPSSLLFNEFLNISNTQFVFVFVCYACWLLETVIAMLALFFGQLQR